MNKKIALVVACLIASFTAASAMPPRTGHGVLTVPPIGATGISLQGMSGGSGYAYINFFKSAHSVSFNAGQPGAAATPASLTNDGYPVNGVLSSNIGMVIALPPKSSYAGDYIIGWTGGSCAATISFTGPSSVTAPAAGHSISGGLVVDFTNFGFGVHGTAGSVQFTVNNAIPAGSTSIFFSGNQTFTNCAGLYLIRADQLTAFNAGQILNPDYINWFTTLNPKILRFMDWPNASGTAAGNATDEADRPPYATAFSYNAERFPTGAWGGSVTGTNTLAIASYPNMPAGNYVDGETVQGIIANTQNFSNFSGVTDNGSGIMRLTGVTSTAGISNGTQITVTTDGQAGSGVNGSIFGIFTAANVVANTSIDLVGQASNVTGSFVGVVAPTQTLEVGTGRGGPKKLMLRLWIPQSADANRSLQIKAGDIGTFSYVADADAWLYSGGGNDATGLVYGAPFEVFIEACNRANKDCWINLNAQLSNDSITALVTYAKNNLNSALNLYLEYGNEVWNPGSGYSLYGAFAGQKAGYPVQNGNAQLRRPSWNSWYARQVSRVKSLATAAWSGRTSSNVMTVLANQAINFPLSGPIEQLRFNSAWVGTRIPITGITQASPAVVTAVGNGFSVGDKVMIGGTSNTLWLGADTYSDYPPVCGMSEIENQALTIVPYTVHAVSGSQVTLFDSTNTNPINSTSFGAWGATAPTITVTGAPSSGTIWTVSGGHHLQISQSIQFTGGTPPAPFKTGVTYFVSSNNFTTTTFSLRPAPVGYLNPNPLDLDITATGAGSGTITFTQTRCGGGQIWKLPVTANQASTNADVFSGAYYYNGPQITTNGNVVGQGNYYSVSNIAGSTNLLGQAYNYVNGNTTQKNAAIAFADNDVRNGTYAPDNVASTNCPNATAVFTMPMNVNLYDTNGAGFQTQNIVYLFGTPPTGFSTNTPYFIRNGNAGAKTFELANPTNIGVSLPCTGTGGATQVSVIGGATLISMASLNGGATTWTGAYPQWGQQLATFNRPWVSYEGGFGSLPPNGTQLNQVAAGKFIASIATTTLTVATMGEGYLAVGQTIFGINGSSVAANTTITGSSTVNSGACTPACTGTGGTGTYAVAVSQTVGAGANMETVGDFYNPPFAYGGDVAVTTPPTSTADWVVSGGHNLIAGNTILLGTNNRLPTGFQTFVNYYVSTAGLTSTNFQLALTQADALAGINSIVATGAGAGTDTYCHDCANIYKLLYDYKFTTTFQQTVQDQLTQQVTGQNSNGAPGTQPGWYHDIGACSHQLGGLGFDSQWALSPCDEYTPPFYSSYTGIQQFNGP